MKVNPFIVMILYISEICVILCVYVQSVMEKTHQGIKRKWSRSVLDIVNGEDYM